MRTRLAILVGAAVLASGLAVAAQEFGPARPPPPPPGYVPGGGGYEPTLPQAIPPEETAPTPPPPPVSVAPSVQPDTSAPTPPKPMTRPRFNAAVLQAIDKVTAETLRFEAKVGEPLRYKGLLLTVHACETTAPDEDFKDSLVHLEVESEPETYAGRGPSRVIYRGWMSANSPGLHPLESPSYDLWLIACKAAAPPA